MSWLCARLPARWRLRLRASYLSGGSPAAQRARRAVLRVVRLGGIPQAGPFPVPGYADARMVPTDSYIVNYLFWLGAEGYEPGGPDWWARLVASHTSVLEVGANVGLYTVVAAGRAAGVPYRAVEPNPPSAAALRRNLATNRLDHVRVDEAAVVAGRGEREVRLRIPARDRYAAAAGAFVEGAVGLAEPGDVSVTVPTLAARELMAGVDLAKFDIEGLELDVLGALRDRLAADRPTLVVEVLDGATGLQAFLAGLIAEAGYRCVVVAGHRGPGHARPVEVPIAQATDGRVQRRFRTRDVTLITPERLAGLGPEPLAR